MSRPRNEVAGSMHMSKAASIVCADLRNGNYSNVAQAIDEMRRLTGKFNIPEKTIEKLQEAFDDD